MKLWDALEAGSPCSSVSTVVQLLLGYSILKTVAWRELGKTNPQNLPDTHLYTCPQMCHSWVCFCKKFRGISPESLIYSALCPSLVAQRGAGGTFDCENWNSHQFPSPHGERGLLDEKLCPMTKGRRLLGHGKARRKHGSLRLRCAGKS